MPTASNYKLLEIEQMTFEGQEGQAHTSDEIDSSEVKIGLP
jgi:hypothetical protein